MRREWFKGPAERALLCAIGHVERSGRAAPSGPVDESSRAAVAALWAAWASVVPSDAHVPAAWRCGAPVGRAGECGAPAAWWATHDGVPCCEAHAAELDGACGRYGGVDGDGLIMAVACGAVRSLAGAVADGTVRQWAERRRSEARDAWRPEAFRAHARRWARRLACLGGAL